MLPDMKWMGFNRADSTSPVLSPKLRLQSAPLPSVEASASEFQPPLLALDLGAGCIESSVNPHGSLGLLGTEYTLQSLIQKKRIEAVMETDVIWAADSHDSFISHRRFDTATQDRDPHPNDGTKSSKTEASRSRMWSWSRSLSRHAQNSNESDEVHFPPHACT
jgi:hypothetical protein